MLRTLFAAAVSAVLTVAVAPAASAHEYKLGSLEIVHPWARATPPNAPVAGGYMVVRNSGSQADRLVAVSSNASSSAEIHEMAVKDGVMTMRPVEGGLEIPAGGEVELKPGGYHIMFMKPLEQFKEGEKRAATLVFEHAGSINVEFNVESMKPANAGKMDHMNHGDMNHGEMKHGG